MHASGVHLGEEKGKKGEESEKGTESNITSECGTALHSNPIEPAQLRFSQAKKKERK